MTIQTNTYFSDFPHGQIEKKFNRDIMKYRAKVPFFYQSGELDEMGLDFIRSNPYM